MPTNKFVVLKPLILSKYEKNVGRKEYYGNLQNCTEGKGNGKSNVMLASCLR